MDRRDIDRIDKEVENEDFTQYVQHIPSVIQRRPDKDSRVNPLTKTTFSMFKNIDQNQIASLIEENSFNGNFLISLLFNIRPEFGSREEIEVFLRLSAYSNGYSMMIQRSSKQYVKYKCPIMGCNYIIQYNFKDGKYHLTHFHQHDTDKCSKFTSHYIELMKENRIKQSVCDYYQKQINITTNNIPINNDNKEIPNNNNEQDRNTIIDIAGLQLLEKELVSNQIKENNNHEVNIDESLQYEERTDDTPLTEIETEIIQKKDPILEKRVYMSSEMDLLLYEMQKNNEKRINNQTFPDMYIDDILEEEEEEEEVIEKEKENDYENEKENEEESDIDINNNSQDDEVLMNGFKDKVNNITTPVRSVSLEYFENVISQSKDKPNISYINTNFRLLFRSPLNSTFVYNYLLCHEKYKGMISKDIINELHSLFPSINRHIIYCSTTRFLLNDDISYSYIPQIIKQLNTSNSNNRAFYMLYNGKAVNNKIDFNTVDYTDDIIDGNNNNKSLLCCCTLIGENIKLLNYSPPVIFLDGTFMGLGSTVTLVITAVNINHESICLGFGFFPSESEEAWVTLLSSLKKVLMSQYGNQTFTIVSDQAKGIKSAVQKVFPDYPHILCFFHLLQDHLRVDLRTKQYIIDSYKASTFEEAKEKAEKIIDEDLRCQVLEVWEKNNKSLQKYDSICKWYISSSVAESYNRVLKRFRNIPIHKMFLCIYNYSITKQINIKTSIPIDNVFLPCFDNIYNRIKNKKYYIKEKKDGVSAVVNDGVSYIVNLEKQTCECKEYQNKHTPCKHAIIFLRYLIEKGNNNTDIIPRVLRNVNNQIYRNQYQNYDGELIPSTILDEIPKVQILKPSYAMKKRGKPVVNRRKRKAEINMEKKRKRIPYVKRSIPFEDRIDLL
ncbi:hypothetical protein WA158_004538 [Blastocystis sp. Blastoise]